MMGHRATSVLVVGGGYLLRRHHRGRNPIMATRMMELFPRGLTSSRRGGRYNNKQPWRGKDDGNELDSRRIRGGPLSAFSAKKSHEKIFGRATDGTSTKSSTTRHRIKKGFQDKIDNARDSARKKIQGLQYKMGDARVTARVKIEGRIEGVKGRVGGKIEGMRDKVEERIEGVRDKVEERIEGVRDKVGDAKASAKVKMEVMQEKVDDAAERGKQTLKTMWQRYGVVALGTYISLYVGVLGALFCIFDSGLLTAADLPTDMSQSMMDRVDGILSVLPGWLENFLRNVFAKMQEKPRMQTLTVAWLATKLTEPARLVTTIFLTPRVARALGRAPKRLKKR